MDKDKILTDLRASLCEIAYLEYAKLLLEWDQITNMPSGAAEARAEAVSSISETSHKLFVSKEFEDKLMRAKELIGGVDLSPEEECIIRETLRDFEDEKKLPTEFIVESTKTASENSNVWAEARRLSDFNMILPGLKKAFDLMRQRAEYLGYDKSPYDALLGEYAMGTTTEKTEATFKQLKDFLVPFIARIADSGVVIRRDFLNRDCPIRKQYRFGKIMARKLGFDFRYGQLDKTPHPMSTIFHPADSRISTRYKRHDMVNNCLGSINHEAGHGMVGQGLRPEYFGTPVGEFNNEFTDLHESQSRLWENAVGKSKSFWKYFFPRMQKFFPGVFDDVSLDEFYRALNYVNLSLVRVDADEVTYNLHVILRFEIEMAIINGDLAVDDDLPSVWNSRFKEAFGIEVPNNSMGILQDCHWPEMLIGYFPTYGLGNIYMPQIMEAAKVALPGLEESFARGEFHSLRNWLSDNIYRYGRMYPPGVVVERVCGQPPDPKYLINYLTNKFSEIYDL